jgi:LPS-assembly protein
MRHAPRYLPVALLLALGLMGQPQAADEPRLPVTLEADEIRGRADVETSAEGDVRLQRGDVTIEADQLNYRNDEDLARARGNVRIRRGEDRFSGPELQLQLQRYEGFFLEPEYFLGVTQAGGTARRIDFQGRQRALLTGATYTSCDRDGAGTPDWLLSANRVQLDVEGNEGIAEGAVLRFLGVPILGAPTLSFPLTSARKSGWLPPSIGLDNRSGFEVGVPYYWNIAPNRDATLKPVAMTRRGVSLDSEFRYLEPTFEGRVNLNLLPHDRVVNDRRYALEFRHQGVLAERLSYRALVLRVSDDDYWKDFTRDPSVLTPRLLPTDLGAERPFDALGANWAAYTRVQQWQVLQNLDLLSRIEPPYERSPQIGVRGGSPLVGGLEFQLETEFNRFTQAPGGTPGLPTGTRLHALGSLSRRWAAPGWWFTPRVSFNAARYDLDDPLPDGRRTRSRFIPTLSVDGGLVFERETRWLGRDLRQTLEPRVLYVNTPLRDQAELPQFDSAGKDFNIVSIYSDNAFSGVDRVSDAHQLTAGVTSRLLSAGSGAEQARFSLVQRYLLRDQQITPDGIPFTQRFSDVLLLGSSSLTSKWTLDAAVQYSPDLDRATRSIVGARYSPGPFRTLNTRYRFTRGFSEQIEFGWQWPMFGSALGDKASGPCSGTAYTVGRVNYSMRDSRITDSVVGFEYDAGCWIGRLVATRLSTGRSEATTRLMLQLELVGLSRLGSNPLQVLKDNIPGYRLLRDDQAAPPPPTAYE